MFTQVMRWRRVSGEPSGSATIVFRPADEVGVVKDAAAPLTPGTAAAARAKRSKQFEPRRLLETGSGRRAR